MKQTSKQTTTAPSRRRSRGYTRGFTPKSGSRGREFKVREVPATFFHAVHAKAKREGKSIRGLILTHLQEWLNAEPKGAER